MSFKTVYQMRLPTRQSIGSISKDKKKIDDTKYKQGQEQQKLSCTMSGNTK